MSRKNFRRFPRPLFSKGLLDAPARSAPEVRVPTEWSCLAQRCERLDGVRAATIDAVVTLCGVGLFAAAALPIPASASAHEVSDRRRSGGLPCSCGRATSIYSWCIAGERLGMTATRVRLQNVQGPLARFSPAPVARLLDSILSVLSSSAWACFGTSSMSTRCAGKIASAKPFPQLLTSPESAGIALLHTV